MANEVTIHVKAKDDASKTMSKVEGSAQKMGAGVKLGAAAVGTALVGMAAKAVAFGVKVASGNEQAKISFTTMLGSAKKADVFLRQLQSFAAKTPFEFPELQTAASSLISVGISAKNVIPIMTTLGNVTSGMGTGSEGVKRATVALQQMSAAGKISAEDLNQLRDAGIPTNLLFDAMAKKLHTTSGKLMDMRDKGKLGRKELEALMSVLKSGKGFERFNGLMDKQSHSLAGLWSTLKDTFGQGMAKLVENAFPALKKGMGKVTKFMNAAFRELGNHSDELKQSFEDIGTALSDSLDPQQISDSVDAFVLLAQAVGKVSKALGKWNKDNGRAFTTFGVNLGLAGKAWTYWKAKALGAMDTVASAMAKMHLLPQKFANAVHDMRVKAERDVVKMADKMAKQKIEVKLRADKRDAQNKIKDINAQLKKTHNARVISKLRADKRNAQQHIREVNNQLNQLNHKTATVRISAVLTHGFDYAVARARQIAGRGITARASGGFVGATAAGGGARSGQVLVGEQGPEIVDLPFGSHVNSNADSRRIGAGGGGGSLHITINAPNVTDREGLRRMLVDMQRRGQLDVIRR